MCTRLQIPIVLCFSTTVHKSQGLSCEFVEVHADDMCYPSLLAVAISRARSSDGLRVLGFTRHSLQAPDPEVLSAIEHHGIATRSEKVCCNSADFTVEDVEVAVEVSDDDDDMETFEQTPLSTDEAGPSVSNCSTVIDLLSKQQFSNPFNSQQQQINQDVNFLVQYNKMNDLYEFLLSQLTATFTFTITGRISHGEANGKIFNDFMTRAYSFMSKDLPSKLSNFGLHHRYQRYISKMFMQMISDFMASEAENFANDSISRQCASTVLPSSSGGDSKIRYVGGRTVYLMRKEIVRRIRSAVVDLTSKSYQTLKMINKCTQQLTCPLSQIKNGKYPDTLNFTEKKTYNRGGMTHITDEVYELFVLLENRRQQIQTVSNGLLLGPNIFKNTYLCLCSDITIKEKLNSVITSEDGDAIEELFLLLLKKYLPTVNNAYRIQLLQHLEKTKSVAHRKRIDATSEPSQAKRAKTLKQVKIIQQICVEVCEHWSKALADFIFHCFLFACLCM